MELLERPEAGQTSGTEAEIIIKMRGHTVLETDFLATRKMESNWAQEMT